MNKGEAERCREMGAEALRLGNLPRAVKLLKKSLSLYPLPGVRPLLNQAETKANQQSQQPQQQQQNSQKSTGGGGMNSNTASSSQTNNNASSSHRSTPSPPQSTTTTNTSTTSATGRSHTNDQSDIVEKILRAKATGRGAHYRVLSVPENADDKALKKAYRKLALKVHPDKNPAPKADEAFKAVGLAYAVLEDSQKRMIYDQSGEEDPDNRGGGGGGGRGGVNFHGQNVSPDDIFNMFFGGQMPGGMHTSGGMGGFRVHTANFGGPQGFSFGGGAPQRQRRGQPRQQQEQEAQQDNPFGMLLQLLPVILMMALSFFGMPDTGSGVGGVKGHTGGSKYFSLTVSNIVFKIIISGWREMREISVYQCVCFLSHLLFVVM